MSMREWINDLETGLESSQVSFFSGQGLWFRFSEYRVVEGDQGGMSIAPARGARLEFYRPFDDYPEILIEYLRLAKFLEFESRDERGTDWWDAWAKRIVQFYEEYGPLGIDWHSFVAEFTPDEERYARVFSSPKPPSFRKSSTYSSEKILKEYQESVRKILVETHKLWSPVKEWQRFREGAFNPGEKWSSPTESKPSSDAPLWREHLKNITRAPAGLGVTFDDDSPRLDYSFDSLLSALSIMFVLSIPPGKIRLCAKPDCKEPFIVTKPKKKYHSDTCGNAMRVRRHRTKLDKKVRKTRTKQQGRK